MFFKDTLKSSEDKNSNIKKLSQKFEAFENRLKFGNILSYRGLSL